GRLSCSPAGAPMAVTLGSRTDTSGIARGASRTINGGNDVGEICRCRRLAWRQGHPKDREDQTRWRTPASPTERRQARPSQENQWSSTVTTAQYAVRDAVTASSA